MRLEIRVVPGAKKNLLKEENGQHKIYLTAPAVDGKANKALVDFLAEHFNVRKSAVEIVRGETSRKKIVHIEGLSN